MHLNKLLPCVLSITAAAALATDAPKVGYIAHEWGTFTSVQGSDGTVLRWNSLANSVLPTFVYARNHPFNDSQLDKAALFLDAKTAGSWMQRMETPVIYLYSSQEQAVEVRVDFPQGHVTKWYPQVSGFGPTMALNNLVPPSTNSFVRWDRVLIAPPSRSREHGVDLRVVPAWNHYYSARETEASFVHATRSMNPPATSENERFLFYRGVGNFPVPLRVSVNNTRDGLVLANSGPAPLRHLFKLAAFVSAAQPKKEAGRQPVAPEKTLALQ